MPFPIKLSPLSLFRPPVSTKKEAWWHVSYDKIPSNGAHQHINISTHTFLSYDHLSLPLSLRPIIYPSLTLLSRCQVFSVLQPSKPDQFHILHHPPPRGCDPILFQGCDCIQSASLSLSSFLHSLDGASSSHPSPINFNQSLTPKPLSQLLSISRQDS